MRSWIGLHWNAKKKKKDDKIKVEERRKNWPICDMNLMTSKEAEEEDMKKAMRRQKYGIWMTLERGHFSTRVWQTNFSFFVIERNFTVEHLTQVRALKKKNERHDKEKFLVLDWLKSTKNFLRENFKSRWFLRAKK